MNNLPDGCSDQDIDKSFGDEEFDDDNSGFCEICSDRYFNDDLRELKDGCDCIYVCDGCLKTSEDIDPFQ